jgi:hypothetical protein
MVAGRNPWAVAKAPVAALVSKGRGSHKACWQKILVLAWEIVNVFLATNRLVDAA